MPTMFLASFHTQAVCAWGRSHIRGCRCCYIVSRFYLTISVNFFVFLQIVLTIKAMSRFSLQFACAFLFSEDGDQFWPQTKFCVTGLGTRPLLSPTLKTAALARERQLLCSHFLQVFVSLYNTTANRANLLRSPVLSVSLPPP